MEENKENQSKFKIALAALKKRIFDTMIELLNEIKLSNLSFIS